MSCILWTGKDANNDVKKRLFGESKKFWTKNEGSSPYKPPRYKPSINWEGTEISSFLLVKFVDWSGCSSTKILVVYMDCSKESQSVANWWLMTSTIERENGNAHRGRVGRRVWSHLLGIVQKSSSGHRPKITFDSLWIFISCHKIPPQPRFGRYTFKWQVLLCNWMSINYLLYRHVVAPLVMTKHQ